MFIFLYFQLVGEKTSSEEEDDEEKEDGEDVVEDVKEDVEEDVEAVVDGEDEEDGEDVNVEDDEAENGGHSFLLSQGRSYPKSLNKYTL